MNAPPRALRFYVVGAVGFLLQVAVLQLLTAELGWAVVPATMAAVESAILHNFVWHRRWTWSDRHADARELWLSLLRFHGANGLVSLAGNAALTGMLAGWAGLHPVAANTAAVGGCGLLNYWLGDRWVFRAGRCPHANPYE